MSELINWANPDANPIRDLENAEEFLCGEWKPDPRDEALHERLSQYYRETDTNRNAWSEFRHWCFERGYTIVDINRAKGKHRDE